jgi:hypothetical protein
MLHSYPLLASLEAYLAHHVSKKWWGIFDTCKAKYASCVTYCPSHKATLSNFVSYLTLCRDRFTVYSIRRKIMAKIFLKKVNWVKVTEDIWILDVKTCFMIQQSMMTTFWAESCWCGSEQHRQMHSLLLK